MIVLLLVTAILVSASAHEKREQRCYGDLGCFKTWSALSTLPQDPAQVQTTFNLYTRQSRSPVVIAANASHSSWSKSISHSHFSASKPTKFLIHGFMNSQKSGWMPVTKEALLSHGDYNVFVVDWGHGAQLPYEQATANVFLVAKQTALFIQNLHSSSHLSLSNVHLIGHSLGAQICGNIGSHERGIGRITGLDPAQPIFDKFDNAHHLDSSDAKFVDVIHSDGADFSGVAGYGWIKPLGHVDFYPNGGMDQPGCSDHPVNSVIHNIIHGDFSHITGAVSCSHGRSHDYFLESIKSHCQFLAHKCNSWKDYENGNCHGCSGGCPQMGLNADKTANLRGSYYLSTTQHSPFCGIEYFVEIDVPTSIPDSFGRFYITLVGQHGSTKEVEFSRQDHYYTKSANTEKHIVAVNKDVGTVTSVKVKYQKGSGLAALGTPDAIKVNSVLVRKLIDSHQVRFCDNNKTVFEGGKSHSITRKC